MTHRIHCRKLTSCAGVLTLGAVFAITGQPSTLATVATQVHRSMNSPCAPEIAGTVLGTGEPWRGTGEPPTVEQEMSHNAAVGKVDSLVEKRDGTARTEINPDDVYTVVLDHTSPQDPKNVLASIRELTPPFDVQVARSCTTPAPLEALQSKVDQALRDLVGESKSGSTTISLYNSDVVVTVSDSEMRADLLNEFGDSIEITVAPIQLASRIADDQPHYGGARIWPGACLGHTIDWCQVNSAGWCSSGITMVANGSGNVFQTTAGHCDKYTWNIYSGYPNGTPQYHMGQVFETHINDNPTGNNTDILAYDASVTYRNSVYADPEQYSRTVTGGDSATVNQYVCQSGVSSLQTCGINVKTASTNITIYVAIEAANRTIYHIARGRADAWGYVVASGDSGGPVYDRNGSDDAVISGSVSAQSAADGHPCHAVARFGTTVNECPQIYFTNINWIEDVLNAHVSTSYP